MKSELMLGNYLACVRFGGRLGALATVSIVLALDGSSARAIAGIEANACSTCKGERNRPADLAPSAAQSHKFTPEGTRRPPTVADSIQMTRIAGSGLSRWYYTGASSSDFATFSPDGKRFIIVVKRGVLEKNANLYSMLLFPTNRAFEAPPPKVVVSFESSSEREGIKNISWLRDNDTVLFLGERPGETTQVYSVRCSSGRVEQLTHEAHNVVAYSASRDGKRLAFATEYPVRKLNDSNALRDGLVVSDESLASLITGYQQICCEELFVTQVGSTQRKPLHVQGRLLEDPVELFLSPDGRYVVLRTYVPKIADFPRGWNQYTDPPLRELLKQKETPDRDATFAERYELIDTGTDACRLLLNAPVSALTQSELTWSPDSRSVIVTGVYLPLDVGDPNELAARRSHMFSVEVRISDSEITKIAGQDLKFIAWDGANQVLKFRTSRDENLSGSSAQVERYRKLGSRWQMLTGADVETDSLPEIVADQNLNQPPRIIAIDPRTGRRGLLWDPNPQFHEIAFGHVEEVTWSGGAGRTVNGGLYLPPDYAPGTRYPLVIQTHGFDPHGFWIDGPFTTAFAAQSLAAKGFIILQVPDSHDAELTPEEAPRMVKTYERAIDYLDAHGLIDRERVGIIGFSRTCFYVKYMLTHSTYKIAAAIVADGVDGGYFQYIAMGGSLADESDQLFGVSPFGAGLSVWTTTSPGFLLDRVTAAIRIQALGPASLPGEWEWYAGLARLQRPVELVYLPEGVHILEKPADRIVSQQGNVDWFCFWLKNEEDSDPRKSEQYFRWQRLRKP
jgi:dipeptidyl aminopeptidase/acylaminoacyl peptidase